MLSTKRYQTLACALALLQGVILHCAVAGAALDLGPQEVIQAGGTDIQVPGYSVPSLAYWNDDSLPDLIVGEGSGTVTPKVRVYLNGGTAGAPAFSAFFYAQSGGSDLTVEGAGCLGLCPRVTYWDDDGKKDLIVGEGEGAIRFFRNVGTDANPIFDAGTLLQVGEPGSKTDISVGYRACPTIVDWNNDGKKDLLVGNSWGQMNLFINEGTDGAPDFRTVALLQNGSADMEVPGDRSCPAIADWDGDGKKDVLSGNTNGELVFYPNINTDAAPLFSGGCYVTSGGVNINFPGIPRTRPSVCDWDLDGRPDVLLGISDGKVYLYKGIPEPATLSMIIVGCAALLRRRRISTTARR